MIYYAAPLDDGPFVTVTIRDHDSGQNALYPG